MPLDYSTVIPVAFTSLVKRSTSLLICVANCSGVPPTASKPIFFSAPVTSGWASALMLSALTRLMMAGGGDAAVADLVDAGAAGAGKVVRVDDVKTNTQTASKMLPFSSDMMDGIALGVDKDEALVESGKPAAVEVTDVHFQRPCNSGSNVVCFTHFLWTWLLCTMSITICMFVLLLPCHSGSRCSCGPPLP